MPRQVEAQGCVDYHYRLLAFHDFGYPPAFYIVSVLLIQWSKRGLVKQIREESRGMLEYVVLQPKIWDRRGGKNPKTWSEMWQVTRVCYRTGRISPRCTYRGLTSRPRSTRGVVFRAPC